jgi:peroxiredoxin
VTFPLLCDTERSVSKLYGVLSIFRLAKRVTVVIDRQGIIRFVIRGKGASDPGNALEAVRSIG